MRKVCVLLASLYVLAAVPADARNGAWYVGGDFGGMIVEDSNFNFSSTTVPATSTATFDNRFGFDGSLFVGYDLGAFRLEGEVSYKRAAVNWINVPGPGPLPAGRHDFDGSATALSFMVNGLLDFGDDDGLSGFIGGGVGVARTQYNNMRVFNDADAFLNDSDTRFAWQVIAGVRQAISDNVDITVRYRFFNVEGVNTMFVDQSHSVQSNFRSHSVLGGMTFNFGAPPPAPRR